MYMILFWQPERPLLAANQLIGSGSTQHHSDDDFRPRKSKLSGISIKYQGKAKTHWNEYESHGKTGENVRYYLKEVYFEEKVLIMGKDKKDDSGEKVSLDAGEHKFPFKFQIPTTRLPHAFEGKRYGNVRYKVKAKIDRPWRFNHNTERLFIIEGAPVDLNMKPEALMPSRSEDEKTLCCLCCTSGPIKATAETDKSGYVPGETLWVSGMVENTSSRDIVDITATLYQKVHYRAKRYGCGWEHHREEKTKLGEQKGEGCKGHRSITFDRKPILVPSCPPSGLDGCNIMSIEHYVEFEADVKGTPFDLDVKLPITIGTVPLKSAYSAAAFAPGVVTQQPTAPPTEGPPPSYEVAMGGPQEIPSKSGHDYTFGKLMYAPKYPYYNFPSDPANPPPQQSLYPAIQGDPAYPS